VTPASQPKSRPDWIIHAIIALVVLGGVAAVFLFAYLPRIHFNERTGTTGRTSTNGSTYECVINGTHLRTLVLADRIRDASSWKPLAGPPPLPVERAIQIAADAFPALQIRPEHWRLDSVTLTDTLHDQSFYYTVRFHRPDHRVPYSSDSFVVAVLLDGSAILPQ
jgi:hypothetical protein